jgi:predicted glycoside hydrolase/deacetylase ChbG (UPF0249 family)
MDEAGYFHQWHPAVYANAKPDAVDAEVNAQVERALAAGIDVTHVDSHMGTILHPEFIESYVRAATTRVLPNLLPTLAAVGWNVFANEERKDAYAPIVEKFESMGVLMLDGILSMPLEHGNDHIGVAKQLFGEVPVGITHFILHPSIDTPELRAIAPDWPARVANYDAFMSDELKKFIESEDLKLIGYRQIRDAMRA